jgi:hypothetical protein
MASVHSKAAGSGGVVAPAGGAVGAVVGVAQAARIRPAMASTDNRAKVRFMVFSLLQGLGLRFVLWRMSREGKSEKKRFFLPPTSFRSPRGWTREPPRIGYPHPLNIAL